MLLSPRFIQTIAFKYFTYNRSDPFLFLSLSRSLVGSVTSLGGQLGIARKQGVLNSPFLRTSRINREYKRIPKKQHVPFFLYFFILFGGITRINNCDPWRNGHVHRMNYSDAILYTSGYRHVSHLRGIRHYKPQEVQLSLSRDKRTFIITLTGEGRAMISSPYSTLENRLHKW